MPLTIVDVLLIFGSDMKFLDLKLLILAAIALAFFSAAINEFVKAQDRLATWIHTEATIVDVEHSSPDSSFPVVSFITQEGQKVQTMSKTGKGRNGAFFVGEKIGVMYSPQNPEDAMLDSEGGQYVLCSVWAAFGVGVTCLAVSYWRKRLRKDCSVVIKGYKSSSLE